MSSRIYVYAFVILLLIYLGLTFGLPINPETIQRYNITESTARLLNLTIVIPLLLIWLTALYGFVSLRRYADTVAETKEGRAFHYLALGLTILAFTLPINSVVSTIRNYAIANKQDWVVPITVFYNHLGVILSLTAFLALATGASALVKTLPRMKNIQPPKGFLIGLIALAAFYSWLITSDAASGDINQRMYYTPAGILVFSLIVPYVIAWTAGILTSYYLYKYHNNVKGILYKDAFKDAARGIGAVVTFSILIQFLTTSTTRLIGGGLVSLLLLIYFLLILYAVGFGLIARGAKKLKKIEEI